MKKIISLTALLLVVIQFSWAQTNQRIKILSADHNTIHKLAEEGIDLRCGATFDTNSIVLELNQYEIDLLNQLHVPYRVEIEDLTKYYSQRLEAELPKAIQDLELEKAMNKQHQGSDMMKSSVSSVTLDNLLQYQGCSEIDWATPANFNLGSMGGCLTIQEVVSELDDMRALYPNLISQKQNASPSNQTTWGNPSSTITNNGQTYSGIGTTRWNPQIIYYVRITGNQASPEGSKPQILYTSMIHSREVGAVMGNIFFMWYILENYDTNPDIKNLVDNNELYFVPVVNPDGLRWNQHLSPSGGGMQRKNLRPNTGSTSGTSSVRGVDLNRNFNYFWGSAGTGSSGTASSDSYRGPSAFSEPETQIMRDFILARNFQTAVWQHTYANAIPHPYGGINTNVSGREDEMHKWHADMTRYNRYVSGSRVLTPANGIADDWMVGEPADGNGSIGSGQNILATTPENGHGGEGGFWPNPSNIVPIAKRMARINFMNAYYGGRFAKLHDQTQSDINSLTSNLRFGIERVGQTPGNFTLTVTPVSSNIASITSPAVQTGMTVLEQRNVTAQITLNPSITPNEVIEYNVTLQDGAGNIFYNANFQKYYQPTVLLADNPDSDLISNWTATGNWNASTTSSWSGSRSIRSNTGTSYGNNNTSVLTTASSYDFSSSNSVVVQFYSKWDIERNFDFVELLGSTDGSTWLPLCGKYTKPAASTQTNDASSYRNSSSFNFQNSNSSGQIYDGDQMNNWVMEEIVIDDSNNSFLLNATNAQFRFRFRSDAYANPENENYSANFDGFYIDDFKIISVNVPCITTVPTGISVSNITPVSAEVTWNSIESATYDLRYREIGAPSWTTITDISNNSYIISGLSPSTNYEVQVASRCTAATSSYSSSSNFTTTAPVPCTGTAITNYPYSETWDGNIGAWTQGTGDDGNWTYNSGTTPSAGTGPNGGFTGSYFYTEASTDGLGFNATVHLISPCFDLTNHENAQFSFYYHMYGAAMGDLTLEATLDNGSSWTSLTTISGQQQGSNGAAWLQEIVDLSDYEGLVIKLRFTGTTGSDYTSDIAIDHINLTADAATSSPPTAVCQNITVQLDATGNATIVAGDVDGGSTDDVAITNYSIDVNTFDCSNIGTPVNVTLTVTDGDGQTDSCVATVTITQQDAPAVTNCWDNYVYNDTTCLWENTGTQPAEPATECWETATFNDTTCSWDVTGTQPAEPTTECWETATFNDTTCSWDVTGTQPAEPATECWETATFNDTTCSWDVTGTQPAEPATECWETATFNDATCSWDVTGTQPVEPATECWETATFNDTTCSWDVTGTQPAEPATECWETATFNDTTCSWDVTGTQPAEPTTECWETATFNDTTCSWDMTGTQPAEPATECWETATFNDTTCSWDVTGTQPAEPATECWETATFNDTTCSWDVTGTQPTEPATECWETATFNDTTCSWEVTGTQPTEPATECWETATFNDTTCSWDVTGTQPAEPTTECWETATFNDTTCSWDVTGTQPAEPATECWETATFNDTTCSWDVTGTQPAEPATECWETATFNDATCSWDVTGTQPAEPATECWETATFNDTTCSWDVTGTQPTEPATECWETATFNDTTCSWDVTGTQPAEPATECWETATFNDTTCSWDVTGTQPVEPATECWETATFNDTTCSWDVTGTQPAEPATECWETATFNDTTCSWDVTGTQPAEPTTECWETATFNDTTCSWDVTGTQPAEPATECWETATFNDTTCSWDVTGTQPAEPATECWETATFNDTTCSWDVTGTQPAEPATECWETATFNDTTCSWDVTGTQPTEPATECWETATFNDTTCSWDVTGTQPAEPATECWETATFNDTTCSWDVTGTQPAEPATECWETATFNDTTCSWDVTGTQPAEPATECWETATFNDTTCSWDITNDGDTIDPICSTQDITVELNESGNASIVASQINNGSSDNCAIDTITLSQYDFTMADIGTNTITMTVTDYSGNTAMCNATVTVIENTLGINDWNVNNIAIYPNPFNTDITIDTKIDGVFSIAVYDLNGRLVFSKSKQNTINSKITISIYNIDQGPYFIKVTDIETNSSMFKQLIKN